MAAAAAAAAAAIGTICSFSRNLNPPSLPAAASPRVPSPSYLHLASSGPRRGPMSPAGVALGGAGLALAAAVASACVLPPVAVAAGLLPLQLQEPGNALSLPTWAIHISSVVEWATAMALVWQYGEKSGLETWKGLSWGMVPLLGGAFCACTWHFFYNSESLEILVALQAALTVIGNVTMCIAAFRIYKSSQRDSERS